MASSDIKKIAVVGAGLTGLAALRRLSENKNFKLTCFERNYDIGGLWLYTDQTLQDDYGNPIHSAVYSNLKTNIPKQLMEIDGFPMDGYPSFPSRTDMLAYLNKVVDECGIRKYIKFNMDVKQIKPVNPSSRDTKWLLTYGDIRKKKDIHTEEFDDVIVCLGNCSTQNYPTIDGEQDFEGFVLHSIRYRHPECFAGQTVAVLGAHYSGIDISFDLSKCAKKVYLCHRGPKLETCLPENIVQKTSGFKRYTPFSVVLENGEELPVDTVIYATGYKYNFSILPEGLLKLGKGNLICNLFKYILTPNYSTIFFMGIVREVAFFPTSEYQALFIKSVLEGLANLPDQEEMKRIISKDSERVIGGDNQWEWIKELSDISGKSKALPLVMKKIWDYHFDIWGKDFAKCRSLVYKATGPDSFVLV
ncbi:uncharacterized protein LOC143058835 [Mytilus galloprovincialis]|uniref:uncharacterized protein LOC143058835 n=1 Tax=Mytilus galloprovincialis TaxID=29158 RepID=UPI003F7B7D18